MGTSIGPLNPPGNNILTKLNAKLNFQLPAFAAFFKCSKNHKHLRKDLQCSSFWKSPALHEFALDIQH